MTPILCILSPLVGLLGLAFIAYRNEVQKKHTAGRWYGGCGLLICGPALRNEGMAAEMGRELLMVVCSLVGMFWYFIMLALVHQLQKFLPAPAKKGKKK